MKSKYFVVGLLAMVVAIGAICFRNIDNNVAYATDSAVEAVPLSEDVDYIVEKHTDIKQYRTKNADGYYAIPSIEKTEISGEWLFAGWYTTADCVDTVKSSVLKGEAYAKFVSADVLSVKCQISTNTIPTSDSTLLRCISSVDSLKYSAVGFDLVTPYVDENGETIEKNMEGSTVGTRIQVTEANEANPCNYSPKVVDTESEYFYSAVETIEDDYFDNGFLVQPYWITKDGTKVFGVSRYITVNEGIEKDVIHIPVKLDEATAESTTSVTIGEITASKVDYDKLGGYAHFELPVDATKLKSVTEYTVTLSDGTTQTYIHRNLNTNYTETTTNDGKTNTADTSWYNTSDDEFVIATSADMYGLANVVNGVDITADTFSEKTIYVVSDITLNKGSATVDGWTTKDKDGNEIEDGTAYLWTPIGTGDFAFEGIFDGQMHTISGLYTNASSQKVGMFGYTASGSVVKKFSLTDSYIYTTGDTSSTSLYAHLGSVVGECCGVVDTVYSNAFVKTPGRRAGGVVGVLNTTDASNSATVTNCWYNGTLNIIDSGRFAGGIVGVAFKNEMNISNCLFTGTINMDFTGELRLGGIVGSENNASSIVNITDCVSSGSIKVNSDNAVGSLIGRIKETNSKYNISASYGTEECYDKTIGSIDGTSPTNIGAKISEDLIYDVKGYQLTLLDLDYWVARTDDVPGLKSFVTSAQLADITDVIRGDISWYDKSATYYIDNAEDLMGFMILSLSGEIFQDELIYLTDDISLNEVSDDTIAKWEAGTQVPNNEWIPIGSGNDGAQFSGVFDGQMHTISGVYVNSNDCYAGLFGQIDYYSVVKNLYLTDSYFYTTGNTLSADSTDVYAFIGSVVGLCNGTIDTVYSDAVVKTSGYRIGGITGALNTSTTAKKAGFNATVSNCWFAGKVKMEASSKYGGGIAGVAVNNDMNITRCVFDGTITSESETSELYIGGIISQNHSSSAVLDIQDCVVAGEINAIQDTRVGALVGYNNKGEYRMVNTYAVEDVYLYDNAGTTIGDMTGAGTVTSNGILFEKSKLQGTDAYVNTLLDFEDSWYALTGDTPVLKVFADIIEDKNVIVSDFTGCEQNNWYSDVATIYNIHSLSAFKAFRDYVNGGIHFASKTVHLCTDLDLNPGWTAPSSATESVSDSPVAWTPIGPTSDTAFRGTFEGNGHQISGLYVKQSSIVGFFGYVLYNGVVRNLRITNSYLRNDGAATGSAVANIYKGTQLTETEYNGAEVSGIYSDAIIISAGRQTGGIVGRADATVKECWFDGEIYTTRSSYPIEAGGIVGTSNKSDDLIIQNCLYSGKLSNTGSVTSSTNSGIGGIYGGTYGSTPSIQISNCVCSGTINADEDLVIGAIAGVIRHASVDCDISNCYAREDIITGKTLSDTDRFIGAVTGSNATGDVSDSVVTVLTNLQGDVVYNELEEGGMNLDFDNTWIARRSNVPVPRRFVGNVVENSATKEKPDGVLRLLMIGNSSCYYFVEELYGMAEAAGIQMEVCNVYSSGCPLKDHWTWYENKESKYQFFTTNADGRIGVSGVSLEYCLTAQDWDVISLQTGSVQGLAINDGINPYIEDSEPYLGNLYNLLKERFPDARLMWHQKWEFEIGFPHSDVAKQVPNRANQTARYEIRKAFGEWVCNTYGVEMVPSGDAWQAARDDEGILDTLCGRIKTGNLEQGDYSHDGDIGGGQYLNACVWFETLTGVSCLDNTYVPDYGDYVLSTDKMNLLKTYAHNAVSNIYSVTE